MFLYNNLLLAVVIGISFDLYFACLLTFILSNPVVSVFVFQLILNHIIFFGDLTNLRSIVEVTKNTEAKIDGFAGKVITGNVQILEDWTPDQHGMMVKFNPHIKNTFEIGSEELKTAIEALPLGLSILPFGIHDPLSGNYFLPVGNFECKNANIRKQTLNQIKVHNVQDSSHILVLVPFSTLVDSSVFTSSTFSLIISGNVQQVIAGIRFSTLLVKKTHSIVKMLLLLTNGEEMHLEYKNNNFFVETLEFFSALCLFSGSSNKSYLNLLVIYCLIYSHCSEEEKLHIQKIISLEMVKDLKKFSLEPLCPIWILDKEFTKKINTLESEITEANSVLESNVPSDSPFRGHGKKSGQHSAKSRSTRLDLGAKFNKGGFGSRVSLLLELFFRNYLLQLRLLV